MESSKNFGGNNSPSNSEIDDNSNAGNNLNKTDNPVDNNQTGNSNIEETEINVIASNTQISATSSFDTLFSQMFFKEILTQSTRTDSADKPPSCAAPLSSERYSTVYDCEIDLLKKTPVSKETLESKSSLENPSTSGMTKNEKSIVNLPDDDNTGGELEKSATGENVSILKSASTAAEVVSGTGETIETKGASRLSMSLNKKKTHSAKVGVSGNNQQEAIDTSSHHAKDEVNRVSNVDTTKKDAGLNLIDFFLSYENKVCTEERDDVFALIQKFFFDSIKSDKFSESYVKAVFNSALSSSALEKYSKSSFVPQGGSSLLIEKVDSLTREGEALSQLRLKRAAILDNLLRNSQVPKDSATGSEFLQSNPTLDDTFLWPNLPDVPEAANQRDKNISGIEFAKKDQDKDTKTKASTSKSCHEAVQDVAAGGAVAGNPLNISLFEPCFPMKPKDNIIIFTNDDKDSEINMDALIMPSVTSLTLYQKKWSDLDNEICKDLLTASPLVFKEKLPHYEQYISIKLDINRLQHNIAKLNQEVKEKVGEVINLLPNILTSDSAVDPKESTFQEVIQAVDEVAVEQNKITMLTQKNKELCDKLNEKDAELEEVARENSNLKLILESQKAELQCSKEANAKLEKSVTDFENIVVITKRKLMDAQHKINNLEECYNLQSAALNQLQKKCEQCTQMTEAMNLKKDSNTGSNI